MPNECLLGDSQWHCTAGWRTNRPVSWHCRKLTLSFVVKKTCHKYCRKYTSLIRLYTKNISNWLQCVAIYANYVVRLLLFSHYGLQTMVNYLLTQTTVAGWSRQQLYKQISYYHFYSATLISISVCRRMFTALTSFEAEYIVLSETPPLIIRLWEVFVGLNIYQNGTIIYQSKLCARKCSERGEYATSRGLSILIFSTTS